MITIVFPITLFCYYCFTIILFYVIQKKYIYKTCKIDFIVVLLLHFWNKILLYYSV